MFMHAWPRVFVLLLIISETGYGQRIYREASDCAQYEKGKI